MPDLNSAQPNLFIVRLAYQGQEFANAAFVLQRNRVYLCDGDTQGRRTTRAYLALVLYGAGFCSSPMGHRRALLLCEADLTHSTGSVEQPSFIVFIFKTLRPRSPGRRTTPSWRHLHAYL